MKAFWRKFSARYRLLLSLLLVALIPICSMLVVFYRYNLEEIKEDVEQINLARVSQIRAGFESEIKGHLSLRQAVCEDTRFLPLLQSDSSADQYDALLRFREYTSYRDAGEMTAILGGNSGQAFQRTGISSSALYYSQLLQLEAEEANRVQETLSLLPVTTDRTVLNVTQKNGDQLLLFCYPLPPYTASQAMLLVPMSVGEVEEIFQPLLGNMEGSAFLLDAQGGLLFSTGENPLAARVGNLADQSGNHVTSLQSEGEDYSVIYTNSGQAGLTYGMIAADSSYQIRSIRQTTLIWQMVLLALLACVIAILLLTGVNYRPLKRLLDLSGSKPGRRINEYEEIGKVMTSSRERAELLESTLEKQRPYVLERILGYALDARLTEEQSGQLFAGMNLRFTYPCFFMISARVVVENPESNALWAFKAAVVEAAQTMGERNSACYTLERAEDNKISVAVNCGEDTDRRTYAQRFYEQIQDRLQAPCVFVLGVGSLSQGFQRLKESLYEANVLAENLLEHPISFIEEMESLPGAFRGLYPVKDMLLFLQELREGDEKAALASFHGICSASLMQEENPLIRRHVCSYVVNGIAETVQQLEADCFSKETEALLTAQTAEQLKKAGVKLIAAFCRLVNQDRQTSQSRLREDILNYINENYTNPNLSLETLAQVFQLSPYYISRFFRDQNNINLKDYIASLRMDRAREWLTQTDKPVAEIVSDLGYQSVSSFIRKFKATAGMTPGRYRDLYGAFTPERSTSNECGTVSR